MQEVFQANQMGFRMGTGKGYRVEKQPKKLQKLGFSGFASLAGFPHGFPQSTKFSTWSISFPQNFPHGFSPKFPVGGKILAFVRFWSLKNAHSAHGLKPLRHNGLSLFCPWPLMQMCVFGFSKTHIFRETNPLIYGHFFVKKLCYLCYVRFVRFFFDSPPVRARA